jgi:glutathione S-transferase
MLTVLGVPFSAHTRKVLVGLREKGLPFELRPLVPLQPELPEVFLRASPLRRIPVLLDGELAFADSSVIALYLDRIAPTPALYPEEPAAYARALWIEEFVDGALAEHELRGLLFQRAFGPKFLGLEPDQALIESSLQHEIPERLAYLESVLDGQWFSSRFSQADVAVTSILLNLHYAGERLDARRFPKLARHFRRALERPSLHASLEAEAPAARALGVLDMALLTELGY